MATGHAAAQLRETGIALLRGYFPVEALASLHAAADRCFEAVAAGAALPEGYRFNVYSHSVLLRALTDFGLGSLDDLLAPVKLPGLGDLFTEALGGGWQCNPEQSWVRKKFAPCHTAGTGSRRQNWHQDGALGVRFPLEPVANVAMTELVTCWIPLAACGVDSPGLEFILGRQPGLLHFTELEDAALRQRFSARQFWVPELELGDGLIFLNSVLHRTHERPEMSRNRMSLEYRVFPADTERGETAFSARS